MRLRIFAIALLTILGIGFGALFYPLVPIGNATATDTKSRLDDELTLELEAYVRSKDTIDALVVVSAEEVLFEFGETQLPINTHSVRKSVMNVLAGAAVAKGTLDVNVTLADLGIHDAEMPLTQAESQARIVDLLMARSGIYIEAAGETPEMKARRPRRGQFAPGERYYYNNWDFNTLGSVLAKATGRPLADHLGHLAERLAFQDYQQAHLIFQNAQGSEHDQYVIYMSARDLAKIGQMMLREGLDAVGETLLTPAWIAESTAAHSSLTDRAPLDGYGYLWSVDVDEGTYWQRAGWAVYARRSGGTILRS